MEIVKYPNPVLTNRCQPVSNLKEAEGIAVEMLKFIKTELKWGNPVGLAANQVGHSLRMFVAMGSVYINPVLTPEPVFGQKSFKEGCYSLEENKYYRTKRYRRIRLSYEDFDGNRHVTTLSGFIAQVVQHEYDHIEGRLCTDF